MHGWFGGWPESDDMVISVQLNLTGTGTELGNTTNLNFERFVWDLCFGLHFLCFQKCLSRFKSDLELGCSDQG